MERAPAYNADVDFVGAGVGEESLGDPEDRVLRRRLHAPPPRRHGSRPDHGAPAQDPTGRAGPDRHGGVGKGRVIEREAATTTENKRSQSRWRGGGSDSIALRDESSWLLLFFL